VGKRIVSPREEQEVRELADDEEPSLVMLCASMRDADGDTWRLGSVPFLAGAKVGTFMCDTGAAVSCVSQEFLEHAGLMGLVRPHSADGVVRQLRLPDRTAYVSAGVVDLEFMVQLMLDVSEGDAPLYVHWDRRILLKGVWVMPFPTGSGLRDMYVSYKDWGFRQGL
jgi:hypothetical protein